MRCGLIWLKKQIPKRHMFKKDCFTCSKYDNHYRFNSQHNWIGGRGAIWPFNEHVWLVTLIMNKIFIQAPIIMTKGGCYQNLNLLTISYKSCVSSSRRSELHWLSKCVLLFKVTHCNNVSLISLISTNEGSIGCSDNIEHKWLCLVRYYTLIK